MVDKRNDEGDEGDEEKKVYGIESEAFYKEGSHRGKTHIILESDECNYNIYI